MREQQCRLLRAQAEQSSAQAIVGGKGLGRVGDGAGEAVEDGAEIVECVGQGGLEQLVLGREMVVEGPHAHIGGLGDLQDRHAQLALRDEALGRVHQGATGTQLAPLKAADRHVRRRGAAVLRLIHGGRISARINSEDFVRYS